MYQYYLKTDLVFIKESLKMDKNMDMAPYFLIMDLVFKDNFLKVNYMGFVLFTMIKVILRHVSGEWVI